MGTIVAVIIVV